jgi:hypothetical protein
LLLLVTLAATGEVNVTGNAPTQLNSMTSLDEVMSFHVLNNMSNDSFGKCLHLPLRNSVIQRFLHCSLCPHHTAPRSLMHMCSLVQCQTLKKMLLKFCVLGFMSWQEKELFFSPKMSTLALRPILVPYSIGAWGKETWVLR